MSEDKNKKGPTIVFIKDEDLDSFMKSDFAKNQRTNNSEGPSKWTKCTPTRVYKGSAEAGFVDSDVECEDYSVVSV